MPLKPTEMEAEITRAGWYCKSQKGSNRQNVHPTKPGKVTIPFHTRELTKTTEHSIRKQAGLI